MEQFGDAIGIGARWQGTAEWRLRKQELDTDPAEPIHATWQFEPEKRSVINNDYDDRERSKKIEAWLAFAISKARIDFLVSSSIRAALQSQLRTDECAKNSRCSRGVEACTCYHAWLRFRQIPVPIASRPHCKHLPRMTSGFGPGLVIPDLWQQEAVRALQQGKDVVVQAPTGSGKTYIFELVYPNLKTQAVFTVLTRVVTTCSGTEPSSSTVS